MIQPDVNAAPSTGSVSAPQYPKWITDILTGIGAPINNTTVDNLWAWNQCEGSDAQNNPFNTTLKVTGSTSINNLGGGVGVQSYPTYAAGLGATLSTLLYTKAFGPIVSALRNSAPRSQFAATVGASGWGTPSSCLASAKGIGGATNSNSGAAGSGGAQSVTLSAPGELAPGTGAGGGVGCNSGDAARGSNCWINFPGTFCITHCEVKAVVSGLIILGSGVVLALGVLILAKGEVAKAAQALPGPAGVAAGYVAGGARRTRGALSRGGDGSVDADEGDAMFEASRGSGAQNRADYRRALGYPSNGSRLALASG